MFKIKSTILVYWLFLVSSIASLNAQNWQSLGTGLDCQVYCFFEDTNQHALYIGGTFKISGGDTIPGIAKWDGQNYYPLGCGMDWDCTTVLCPGCFPNHVLSIVKYKNELYATGGFNRADNITVNGIAKWDGNSWTGFGNGLRFTNGSQANGNSLAVYDNELYLVGCFDSIDGVPANSLAKYDGVNWSAVHNLPLIDGIDVNHFSTIAFYQGEIYVGGIFNSAAYPNDTIQNIIRYDGSCWKSVGGGIHKGWGVNKLEVYKNELYVAGSFIKSEGNIGNNIQKWDGINWSDMNNGMSGVNGFSCFIKDLIVYHDDLYAAGGFIYASGIPAKYIARWDGSKWCGFGSTFNDVINSLGVYNDNLFIGGGFNVIDEDSIYFVAKWTGGSYVDTCGNMTGIEPNELQEELIAIYPNPATNTLSIDGLEAYATTEVYDISGKLLLNKTLNSQTIDISSLANGLYFIKLTTKKGSVVRKFVKE